MRKELIKFLKSKEHEFRYLQGKPFPINMSGLVKDVIDFYEDIVLLEEKLILIHKCSYQHQDLNSDDEVHDLYCCIRGQKIKGFPEVEFRATERMYFCCKEYFINKKSESKHHGGGSYSVIVKK